MRNAQRAGALWDEYVLNLHRLRWDKPRHLPKPRAGSKTRTALRQLGIRKATDLLKASR